jgi:hypothetical protein
MMPVMSRRVRLAAVAAFIVAAPGSVPAGQIQPWDQKFSRGQTVVPVYESWERNADGSATMVFGYMNRNYEQHVYAPLGRTTSSNPVRRIAVSPSTSCRGASSSSSG